MSAWTSDQLAKLEEAIAQGSLIVKYGDKQVTYRSLEEMLRIRELMRAELGVSKKPRGGRYYPYHSKGTSG